jgi:hypothetical protein
VRGAHYARSSWQETDADALSLSGPAHAVDSVQLDGGVRIARTRGRWLPAFEGRYRRELADEGITMTQQLGAAPEGLFAVDGLPLTQDSVLSRAGLTRRGDRYSLSFDYTLQYAAGLTRQTVQFGLRLP